MFPIRLKILAIVFLSSCSGIKEGSENNFAELNSFFEDNFPATEPGGAILIMKGEEIIFSKGYGIADLQTREPITSKTLFNLGSISKTFVANAILILQSQGKLSIEDSLSKYFDFKNVLIGDSIKIKHLLTHTSGLPDNRNVSDDTVFYLFARDEDNWTPVLKTDSLNFEPGSRFEYSNPAFNGLALIVEKVSHMKWQQFVKLNIMKPSGMTESTITDGPYPESKVSHAYVNYHGQWKEDDYGEEPTFPAAGNGGVWSSVEELANYELAIQQGKFLDVEVIKESRTPQKFPNWSGQKAEDIQWSWLQPKTASAPFIGWSWFVVQNDGLNYTGHTGTQGGFICNYLTIPEKDVFFVILCNTPKDIGVLTNKIISSLKENNLIN